MTFVSLANSSQPSQSELPSPKSDRLAENTRHKLNKYKEAADDFCSDTQIADWENEGGA